MEADEGVEGEQAHGKQDDANVIVLESEVVGDKEDEGDDDRDDDDCADDDDDDHDDDAADDEAPQASPSTSAKGGVRRRVSNGRVASFGGVPVASSAEQGSRVASFGGVPVRSAFPSPGPVPSVPDASFAISPRRMTDQLCGWLWKRKNKRGKAWKRRWCYYDKKRHRMYYFEREMPFKAADAKNFISLDPLTTISPITHDQYPEKSFAGFGFQMDTSYTHRPYVFCAESKADYAMWIRRMREFVCDINSHQDEEAEYIEKVFASFRAAKRNPKRNYAVVDVQVIEARLPSKGDYFAAVYAHNRKFKTNVHSGSEKPVWNCDGTFVDDIDVLRVKMFQKSRLGKHRCIAETVIDLQELPKGQQCDERVLDQWYSLRTDVSSLKAKAPVDDLLTASPVTPSRRRRGAGGQVKEDHLVEGLVDVHLKIQRTYALSDKSINADRGVPTSVLPIRVDTGDVFLFHSSHFASYGTKLFTRSQWDHVAFVFRWANSEMKILEATSVGVGLYKLNDRLDFLHKDSKIGIRRLEGERTPEMLRHLHAYVRQMRGRKYKKDKLSIVGAVVKSDKSNKGEEDLSTAFCSELVAAAYQRMGLLSNDWSAKAFLPKHWADKSSSLLQLTSGYTLNRKRIFSKFKERKGSLLH